MNIKRFLVSVAAGTVMFGLLAAPALAGNPSADADCETVITDPYGILGTGTRAEVYGCKPVGNSGEEQGVYSLEGPAPLFGYDVTFGICNILVKWSGDYGLTPYLDFGTVYNRTMCSNGYMEVWGDRFAPPIDPYGATPYVYTIGGLGDQLHRPE